MEYKGRRKNTEAAQPRWRACPVRTSPENPLAPANHTTLIDPLSASPALLLAVRLRRRRSSHTSH